MRWRPESVPSRLAAGSTRSRPAAQIARLTAACTAIRLAVNPIVSITRITRPMPEPSAVSSVVVIGSATLPERTPGMLGMARMMPRQANMTRHPATASEPTIALGRTWRDSLTSSAIDPADSKPTNEYPMKATAPRNGLNSSDGEEPAPAPWNRTENELLRWKTSRTNPIPTDAMSSQVSVRYSRRLQ